MVDHPNETTSDTFYFVDNKLIMHNKASYSYIPLAIAESKESSKLKSDSKLSKHSKGY